MWLLCLKADGFIAVLGWLQSAAESKVSYVVIVAFIEENACLGFLDINPLPSTVPPSLGFSIVRATFFWKYTVDRIMTVNGSEKDSLIEAW